MECITEKILLDNDFPFEIYDGVGFRSVKEAYSHNHYCLELNFCITAGGTYFIGDNSYPIKQGDMFIINNYEYHYAINETSKMELMVVVFNPDLVWNNELMDFRYIKAFYEWKDGFKHRLPNESFVTEDIKSILFEMHREWNERATGYRLVLKSLLLKLLAILYRRFEQTDSFSEKVSQFQSRFTRISDSVNFIDNSFRDNISLDNIAEKSHMNSNYFSGYFHDTMHCTVSEYILNLRIKHACMRLVTSDESIISIAADSGFKNVPYFNRTFKKRMGITPQQYRQQNTM